MIQIKRDEVITRAKDMGAPPATSSGWRCGRGHNEHGGYDQKNHKCKCKHGRLH